MCLQTKLENLQNLKPTQIKAKVPAWAKPTPFPRSNIRPHLECEFPAWTKRTAPVDTPSKIPMFRSDPAFIDFKDIYDYIEAFEVLNNLKPVPVEIVTCEAFG